METLAESSSIPNISELRNESSVPTSPDGSPNTMDEQSQSSQDSLQHEQSSLPNPDYDGHDDQEESVENIEKELLDLESSPKNASSFMSAFIRKIQDDVDTLDEPEPEEDVNEKDDTVRTQVVNFPEIATNSSPSTTSTFSTKLINVKTISNGGKPMMAALNKKMKSRGRPKQKNLVTIYQSQISDNKIGIKLCLKKSPDAIIQQPKTKPSRKRSRKSKQKNDSDESGEDPPKEKRKKKESNKKASNNNTEEIDECKEQGVWGSKLPDHVLFEIFKVIVNDEGSVPTLVKLGQVCRLWHEVSLRQELWRSVDLGSWTKDKCKSELRLKWLIENRLTNSVDVNMANWKVTNVQVVLEKLSQHSPNLVGISMAGWKHLAQEDLAFLVSEFKSLQRIDLSSVNVETSCTKTALSVVSLSSAITEMGDRLTHLYLAHNRLAGIPQIIKMLSNHCPNLSLLDLSNVTTVAISHGVLHIEQLQHGCPKLKILRITNSHIVLATASLQEQMDSPGFPELEELSVASNTDESRVFNDEFLQRILKTSTQLKLLDVRGCARLTHDSLIRLPTWDLKHLFLSGCSITRDVGSGLELIASKWAHSLIELDLAWANVQKPLDDALLALAEKGPEAPLNHLNLCGSSVSLEAVKELLANCPSLISIDLASCRGLPRGVKRLIQGPTKMKELREILGVTLKGEPNLENKN